MAVFYSCGERSDTSRGTIEDRPEVAADTFFVSDARSEIVISRIIDIAVDSDESVYLLDSDAQTVWKFDSEGSYMKNLLAGRGRGPGETIRPTSIAVDTDRNLYVTDLALNRMLILDENGEPLSEAALSIRPSRVAASDLSAAYVTGFRFSMSDYLVYKLTRSGSGAYSVTDRFVEQRDDDRSRAMVMSGWSDQIKTTSDGSIFVSRFYPYHIQKFNADLDLQFTVEREVDFITSPALNNQGIVTLTGVMREVLPIDNDRFLVRYSRIDEEQNFTSYLDLYDSSGEFIETYSFQELGIKEDIQKLASVPDQAILYAIFNNPYPGVIRYRFNL